MHKIVVVTPAGRQKYLEVLNAYIQSDRDIDEWVLFDNCRNENDRQFLEYMERNYPKITVKKLSNPDGKNGSVNQIYPACNDEQTFYIKLDDDIVYLDDGFAKKLYQRALERKDAITWISPLVINNAICTFLIKHFSKINIPQNVSAQAGCDIGWRNPGFAKALHTQFVRAAQAREGMAFHVPDAPVYSSRFSINSLGFFGETVAKLGRDFCPPDVDDEEWLSAVLPLKLGRPGYVAGDIVAAHFAFYTQEDALLATSILDDYRQLASVRVSETVRELEQLVAQQVAR